MVLFYRVSAISIKKRRKMKEKKTLASCCKYGSLYCSVDFRFFFNFVIVYYITLKYSLGIVFTIFDIDHFYSSQVVATHLPLDACLHLCNGPRFIAGLVVY